MAFLGLLQTSSYCCSSTAARHEHDLVSDVELLRVSVKRGVGAAIAVYLFFFKECSFRVRVRLGLFRVRGRVSVNPNPNPKTAFFKETNRHRHPDPGPDTQLLPCYRLFTVPYFFVRSFRYTASYRHGYLDFQMYRGGGRRGL